MLFPDRIDYRFHGEDMVLPRVFRARQKFPRPRLQDVPLAVRREMAKLPLADLAGKRVALTGGSRGVADQPLLLRTVAAVLKEHGAKPFIVPAMGSHGGATAEGQRAVLADCGIAEETMGAPVLSSMEVVRLGVTASGFPVYCDKLAAEADWILPVHRVKPHTDFKADIESGLCKMMVIGLGKHRGATHIHSMGLSVFGTLIPEAAGVFLASGKSLGGVAVVENAYDETMLVEAVLPGNLLERERALQSIAKEAMPRFLVDAIDVLVIEQFGKDISGAGMDSNITARPVTGLPGFTSCPIQRIALLGLTERTHGSGIGLGVADVVTNRFMRQLDLASTYINALTSRGLEAVRLPLVANHDLDAVRIAVHCAFGVTPEKARIVQIADTLHMGDLVLSEPYLERVRKDARFDVLSEPHAMQFDGDGTLRRIAQDGCRYSSCK